MQHNSYQTVDFVTERVLPEVASRVYDVFAEALTYSLQSALYAWRFVVRPLLSSPVTLRAMATVIGQGSLLHIYWNGHTFWTRVHVLGL
jgi:hypothetical protein